MANNDESNNNSGSLARSVSADGRKLSSGHASRSISRTEGLHSNEIKKSPGNKKSPIVHTYSTVEANIEPMQSRLKGASQGSESRLKGVSPHRSKNKHGRTSISSLSEKVRSPSRNTTASSSEYARSLRAFSPVSASRSVKSDDPDVSVISPQMKCSILQKVYSLITSSVFNGLNGDDSNTQSNSQKLLTRLKDSSDSLWRKAGNNHAGFSNGGFRGVASPSGVSEAYLWCDTWRVYVLQQSGVQLLVLLPPTIPRTVARSLAQCTMDIFFKGKTARI